jgi:chromosomal replication initiator protein
MLQINPYSFPGLRLTPKIKSEVKDIISAVYKVTKVSWRDISSESRLMDIKDARHLLAYFLREKTSLTWMKIGNIINKDHSSAMHGHKKVKETRHFDKQLNNHASKVTELLSNQVN